MRPYATKRTTTGASGTRRSVDSPHRRRALRRDKRAARQAARLDTS